MKFKAFHKFHQRFNIGKIVLIKAGEREKGERLRNEIQDAVDVPEYKYTRRELLDNTYIMTGLGARPQYKSRSCYSRERKAGRIAEGSPTQTLFLLEAAG